MQIDARLGTYADVRAAAGGLAPVLDAIRAVMVEVHSEAFEVASRREKSVWWGWGAAKMKTGYAYAMPHRAHMNLGFFQGASLPDPEGLLEGSGKALRHLKLREIAEVARPAVRDLVIAARNERADALGLR